MSKLYKFKRKISYEKAMAWRYCLNNSDKLIMSALLLIDFIATL